VAELVEITKLSNYKVSDALKILAEHNVLIRTKEIRKDLLT
jgi:DNA-binding transcriptional regulator GbsR (MarR family)